MNRLERSWRLTLIASDYNWDASDYLSEDELKGRMREYPPFGSPEHRWLSTVLLLRKELDRLKAL
jgi:hypothetical protein